MTTEMVHLRPVSLEDVDAIYAAADESRAELSCWMAWCHADYGRDDAAEWVECQAKARDAGQDWSFRIVDIADRLLGVCGIHRVDAVNRVAEAGYWVRSSATGRGIATAALRQLVEWGFREQQLHRIEILVAEKNLASQRVAEKAGGMREALLKDRLLLDGRRCDCVLYAVINGSA